MNGGSRCMHENPKLSMMKLIVECEVESGCAFLKSKIERRIMLKLRGGHFRLRWEGGMGNILCHVSQMGEKNKATFLSPPCEMTK